MSSVILNVTRHDNNGNAQCKGSTRIESSSSHFEVKIWGERGRLHISESLYDPKKQCNSNHKH